MTSAACTQHPGEVIAADAWRTQAKAHADRLAPYLRPHLRRRATGEPHPVHDFMFGYYGYRPSQLTRWHPGFGHVLVDAPAYLELTGYQAVPQGASVSPDYLRTHLPRVQQTLSLLEATAMRPGVFGCFALHEWAMVYRADEHRHQRTLRLGRQGTDQVVESHRIACSHFDAYRFFTPEAHQLNTLSPSAATRAAFEQPGCLHATMDLYKHAFRLSPLVGAELVADCFELAWQVRNLDMRAAPYDLTGLRLDPNGDEWTPIRIETPDGKAEFTAVQRALSSQAEPLRDRLITACRDLVAAGSPEQSDERNHR